MEFQYRNIPNYLTLVDGSIGSAEGQYGCFLPTLDVTFFLYMWRFKNTNILGLGSLILFDIVEGHLLHMAPLFILDTILDISYIYMYILIP